MNRKDLASEIYTLLNRAQTTLLSLDPTQGKQVVQEGKAFGDLVNDTDIRADKVLGEFFENYILKNASIFEPDCITVEGRTECRVGKGTHWITVDPLDGSLSYFRSIPGVEFPYTACVTVLEKREGATFADIIAAGVVDLRRSHMISRCLVHRDEEKKSFVPFYLNTIPLQTRKEQTLTLKDQIVIGELYYPDNRELLVKLFAGESGSLRNSGSAAWEMMTVAAGVSLAYICKSQKQHELGMAYALVKAAGGVAWDFDGNDLAATRYEFNIKTPVILAANEAIGAEILKRLRK